MIINGERNAGEQHLILKRIETSPRVVYLRKGRLGAQLNESTSAEKLTAVATEILNSAGPLFSK